MKQIKKITLILSAILFYHFTLAQTLNTIHSGGSGTSLGPGGGYGAHLWGMTVSPLGDFIYVTDASKGTVHKISTSSSTTPAYSDTIIATGLNVPTGIAYYNGNLYVGSQTDNAIYEIPANYPHTVSTYVSAPAIGTTGNGTNNTDGQPAAIIVDANGMLYVGTAYNHQVYTVAAHTGSQTAAQCVSLFATVGVYNTDNTINGLAIYGTNIYAAASQSGSVYTIPLNNSSPTTSITTKYYTTSGASNYGLWGINFDKSGNTFISSYSFSTNINAIYVFPFNNSGTPITYASTKKTTYVTTNYPTTSVLNSTNIFSIDYSGHVQTLTNTVLPINLLNFNGLHQNNDNILNWQISNAVNFSHFELQKLKDNNNQFEKFVQIDYLAGKNDYSYTDKNIFTSSIYRLAMIDLNGSTTYSNAININVKNNIAVTKVFPTINASAVLNVSLNSTQSEIFEYAVFNQLGSLVLSGKQTNSGENIHQIDISHLSGNGVYFLKIYTKGNLIGTYKFLKK